MDLTAWTRLSKAFKLSFLPDRIGWWWYGNDSHLSVPKRSKPSSDDPQARFAVRIRTCNLGIRRHPIICMRYPLLSRQERENGAYVEQASATLRHPPRNASARTEGINGETLARGEMQHLSL